jgi:hypothetical protein
MTGPPLPNSPQHLKELCARPDYHLFKSQGCAALADAPRHDPLSLAQEVLASDRPDFPLIFGGYNGTLGVPELHHHVDWPQQRKAALHRGRLRKQAVQVLLGVKGWVIYPCKAVETFRERLQSSYVRRFHFNPYLPYSLQVREFEEQEGAYDEWRAAGWRARLEPGDIMLLPSCHLHHVRNEAQTVAMTFPVEMQI